MNNHHTNGFNPQRIFRLTPLFVLLALAAAACGSFDIDVSISEDGSGVRSEQALDLDLSGVDSVEVSGIWDADVIIGEGADGGQSASVDIVLDDNFTKYTDIKVDGSVLQIEFDRGNLSPEITPTATIHLPNVERIEVDGAASAAVRGDVTTLANISLSGASEINVSDLDVGSLTIDLDGASEVSASGTADTGTINMDGSSSAQLSGLTWMTVDIDLNGSSDLQLTATDRVSGEANGASDVKIAGGAAVDVSSSGASTISSE